jgi:hypothetical protein
MRIEKWIVFAMLLTGCKKAPPAATAGSAAPAAAGIDPDRAVAVDDLKHDLAAARAAIAAGKNPTYALDRMQVAAHALADERDDGVLKLLAEAETVYSLQGPVAYAESKLMAIEKSAPPDGGAPAPKPEDCFAVRDMLNRVGAKFNGRTDVQAIVTRWKAACPKELRRGPRGERGAAGGGGGYSGGSSSTGASAANLAAQRGECKRRCEDAGFHCRAGCPSGCTTDKTWEFCNARNQQCRDGCEQNEKFCKVSCGD